MRLWFVVNINLERFCKKLGYQFTDQTLLKRALTHCSMGAENYERFEFLGDSILSFVIAEKLLAQFPEFSEGKLSRLRSFLVKGDMLAEIGAEIGLGDFLILGQGELKSGGFRRASTLADSLEAVFAAVFYDGGIDAAKKVVLKLYHSRLSDPSLSDCLIDAKTQLQEYLQAQKRPLPNYTLLEVVGDEHAQIFYVSCSIKGVNHTSKGQAPTRRKAEQQAAKLFLQYFLSSAEKN